MASVSMEFSAYTDPRFKLLGKLTGTDHWAALARVSSLWMHCLERGSPVVRRDLIDALMEIEGYASALVSADLAEAIENDANSVRIRGTKGRIEWLKKARVRQKRASAAAKAKRDSSKVGSDLGPNVGSDFGREQSSSSASASASVSSSASTEKTENKNKPSRSRAPGSVFDLDAAYQKYPLKKGKKKGMQKLAREIRTEADYQSLLAAIDRYSECSEVKKGFIKHFSTFAHEWTDWTDPDAGSSTVEAADNAPVNIAAALRQVRGA